jgi:hypothetical protein
MRRSVTLLIALLLATAAAAGAGDNVKWERSALIPCFTLDADVASSDDESAAVLQRYTLSWDSARRNAAVGHVGALFYGWEVHCARLRREAAQKQIPDFVLQAKAEEARALFERLLFFFVTVAVRDEADANLADPSRWEIYLLRDGVKQNPTFLGEPDAAFRDITVRPISVRTAPGTLGDPVNKTPPPAGTRETDETAAYRKIYKVAFDNPWEDAPRGSMKLVITGEKFRRGFEWRFVEE